MTKNATLRFRHQVFMGTSLRIHPPHNHTGVIPKTHLRKIGIAVQPPCLDANHPSSNDTPETVQVARIVGVSPRIAVAALPEATSTFSEGQGFPCPDYGTVGA
jgi:hypothetical protein